MRLPSASPVWQQAATLEPQAFWMGMATVHSIVSINQNLLFSLSHRWRCQVELTDGDAQAVGADQVLAAVAAGDLLAVAADGAVVLAVDLDFGVAGGLGVHGRGGLLGGGGLCGRGGLAVAGGGGDEDGHGGDEEGLHEGHFEGWIGLVGGVGGEWLVEWKRVCWIGCGLDVLDDEEKLSWREMETGVLIPVGRQVSGWLPLPLVGSLCLLCLVRLSVLW